jgi:hypothetical protein
MHAPAVNQNTGEKIEICYKRKQQRQNMHSIIVNRMKEKDELMYKQKNLLQ